MSNEEKFIAIKQAIQPYKRRLAQAADTIIDENVSSYPIFVVHQLSLEVGIKLVSRNGETDKWNIHASTLEEFVAKQLIASDKVDDFKKVYKNPQQMLCLFVLSDAGATYVFLPRL